MYWYRRNYFSVGAVFASSNVIAMAIAIGVNNKTVNFLYNIFTLSSFVFAVISAFIIINFNLSPFFEEKYQLLNYVEPNVKKYYQKLLFKYDLYYKRANEAGREEIKEKIENMMAETIKEAKHKKEKEEQRKEAEKKKKMELFLQKQQQKKKEHEKKSQKTLKKFQEEFENDQQRASLLKIDG